ncbi:MAG TPA: hypothetical protein VM820_07085 [Vicinamibacterales bacterium]|nr:hypothetical protein [Vicinamibacterales bacterium]
MTFTSSTRFALSSAPPSAEHDLLDVTAHHEAGHAMAAVMRGGSSLRGVTIDVDRPGHGLTLLRTAPWDTGFMAYAGPWAEARFVWGNRPLDAHNDNDCTFSDCVVGVLLHQSDDAAMWGAWHHEPAQESVRQAMADLGMTFAPEEVWDRELELVWPEIQTLAQRIRAGESVTDTEVRDLYEATLLDVAN